MMDGDPILPFHFMQPCIKRIWVTRLRKEYHLWNILEPLGYNCVQKPVWKVARNHCMLASNFFLKGCQGSCAQIYELMYSNNTMTLRYYGDSMNSSHRQSELHARKSIYQDREDLYSPGSGITIFVTTDKSHFFTTFCFSHHEVGKEIVALKIEWYKHIKTYFVKLWKGWVAIKCLVSYLIAKFIHPQCNYLIMQRWKFLQKDAL